MLTSYYISGGCFGWVCCVRLRVNWTFHNPDLRSASMRSAVSDISRTSPRRSDGRQGITTNAATAAATSKGPLRIIIILVNFSNYLQYSSRTFSFTTLLSKYSAQLEHWSVYETQLYTSSIFTLWIWAVQITIQLIQFYIIWVSI